MTATLEQCQRTYDPMLPEYPEEIEEKEARKRWKEEQQIDEWEFSRNS